MSESLADQLAPHGELESTLFDAILHAGWNIRRCRLLEAGLMKESGLTTCSETIDSAAKSAA